MEASFRDGVKTPPARCAGLRLVRGFLCIAVGLLLGTAMGCSIKRMAVKSVASSLTSGPDVFASDDDPDLVRDAIPFGLKLMESLLTIVPDDRNLLLASCRGFTQYSFAFLELEALAVKATDRARAAALRERALKLYLRARDYGLRGLELRHRGIASRIPSQPEAEAQRLRDRDVPMMFWTAAAWGSAISVGRSRPELVADLEVVRALMRRTLELDEGFEAGAVHEVMIILESLPAMMGGSMTRARKHFERAIELSEGARAGPYVTLAENVSVMEQDRAEFVRVLRRALQVNPDDRPEARLQTILFQRRARALLESSDELFLEPDTTTIQESP